MLLSLALILTMGLILGELFGKIGLPKFIGMIITGIVLGPYVFDLISDDILNLSGDLRLIALIVILIRAGLTLDVKDIKIIGKPAVLMSFVPAILEVTVILIFAPLLFDITYLDAAILGSVIAAVSPAVIVPKMITLVNERWGMKKRVPHLILASASVDDIFVIILFSSLIEMATIGTVNLTSLYTIPIAILSGLVLGYLCGLLLSFLFSKLRVRDTVKALIFLAIAFFILSLETQIDQVIPLSGLLSIMIIGISFLKHSPERAHRLRNKFEGVWVFAELVLFVLVGAAVNINVALNAGLFTIILLIIGLSFRILGVQLSLIKSNLNKKERLFTSIAFTPKATVQAAIGAIPLSLGLASGDLILALAVLAILITAPLGAFLIDMTYPVLLEQEDSN